MNRGFMRKREEDEGLGVCVNWVGNYVIRQHHTTPIATKANALNDISFAYFDLSLGFSGDGICYYFQRQNDFFDRILTDRGYRSARAFALRMGRLKIPNPTSELAGMRFFTPRS